MDYKMNALELFVAACFPGQEIRYEPIAKAGSDRQYLRVYVGKQSYIVCISNHIPENNSFLYFANLFHAKQLPVPEIIAVSADKKMYIQTDAGSTHLLDVVLAQGHTPYVYSLYEKSLAALAQLQTQTTEIDYNICFQAKQFDHIAVLADLNYFKYYFLDLQIADYPKYQLQCELESLSNEIAAIVPQYFMYRDFQGRNILIQDGEPVLIDFQGGMKGPIQYDAASLLWQAKAQLPADWKQSLFAYYMQSLQQYIPIDSSTFETDYSKLVLIRLMQVMGAYGLRGLIEKRPHFVSSIPHGLQHLSVWLQTYTLASYPVLQQLLQQITTPSFIQQFI